MRPDAAARARLRSSLASRIGVRLFAQRQADRRAWQTELVAQPVDEKSLISVRHRVGTGAEDHEAGRPCLRLGDVVELETPSRYRGRRVRGQRPGEPPV